MKIMMLWNGKERLWEEQKCDDNLQLGLSYIQLFQFSEKRKVSKASFQIKMLRSTDIIVIHYCTFFKCYSSQSWKVDEDMKVKIQGKKVEWWKFAFGKNAKMLFSPLLDKQSTKHYLHSWSKGINQVFLLPTFSLFNVYTLCSPFYTFCSIRVNVEKFLFIVSIGISTVFAFAFFHFNWKPFFLFPLFFS